MISKISNCVLLCLFTASLASAEDVNVKGLVESQNQVRAVIEKYVEGTYEGDAKKLNSVFHPKAVMSGYLMGNLIIGTPELFIADITKSPIKDQDTNYQSSISYLEVDGNVATVVLLESGFPGNVSFSDYFHLLREGSDWKIMSKTFMSHVD